MKIEKGQNYLCVKSVNDNFIVGKVYTSTEGNSIPIPNSEKTYRMTENQMLFMPIKQAKWAIKRTPENADEVNRWANEKMQHEYAHSDGYILSDYGFCDYIKDGYTEIDLTTFREITGIGEEKEYTIEDLSNGFCALINDGTLEDLKEVISIAFKGDSAPEGKNRFYQLDIDRSDPYEKKWDGRNSTYLKTQSVHKFLTQIYKKEEPKIDTIEDVRNGKCAIDFDDRLQLPLKKLLTLAFPDDTTHPNYNHRYFYSLNAGMSEEFDSGMVTDLPTQSVKLFLKQIEAEKESYNAYAVSQDVKIDVANPMPCEITKSKGLEKESYSLEIKDGKINFKDETPIEEWQPKWGEPVQYKTEWNEWFDCFYIATSLDGKDHYLEFEDKSYTTSSEIRKPIKTFTIDQAKQDLAKLHNLNVNQIKIVE